jgi:AcrR family transcriptional regulator
MKKLLREPLVHFLALGAILFLIGILRGEAAGPAANHIAVTPGAIERLLADFRLTWQRKPTEQEFRGLVEEYLKEEMLYRTALEMGLDRDDQVIRRRLRQRVEFLTADLVESFEPTEEELQAYLDANPDPYRQEMTVTFLQAYIGERGGPEQDESRALALLEELRANPNTDPEQVGDPFMHPPAFWDIREMEVSSLFGEGFAAQLLELPLGEWSGPVTSAFGFHVVRVDGLVPGRASELVEVLDAVHRDLVGERTREADERYFEALLGRYMVTVEWPEGMAPVDLPGVVR